VKPIYFPTKLSAGLAERADEIAKVTPLGRAGGDYDIKGPVGVAPRQRSGASDRRWRFRCNSELTCSPQSLLDGSLDGARKATSGALMLPLHRAVILSVRVGGKIITQNRQTKAPTAAAWKPSIYARTDACFVIADASKLVA
jgi:hypothetical protein